MEPINQAERKAAITKLTAFLILSFCLLVLPFVFYSLIPSAKPPNPVTVVEPSADPDPNKVADIQARLSILAERLKKTNIMFLVDATEGMEKHLPAVAQAASSIEQQYQVEIQAACYRDAAEGAWLYMSNSMVGAAPASWISSLDTKAQFDQDEPEALYYGLRQALGSSHLAPNETNILILVGDAGNHAQEQLTDVSPNEIVQLLTAKQCHLGAFQARNPTSSTSYADFSSQLKNDIFNAIKTASYQEKDSADSFGRSYMLEGSTFNTLYTTNPAQSLSDDALSTKINGFVARVLTPLQQRISTLEALAQGNNVSLEPTFTEFLQQNQFTPEEIELLSN